MGRTLPYGCAQFNCTHDARWSGLEADVIIEVLPTQLISKRHLNILIEGRIAQFLITTPVYMNTVQLELAIHLTTCIHMFTTHLGQY